MRWPTPKHQRVYINKKNLTSLLQCRPNTNQSGSCRLIGSRVCCDQLIELFFENCWKSGVCREKRHGSCSPGGLRVGHNDDFDGTSLGTCQLRLNIAQLTAKVATYSYSLTCTGRGAPPLVSPGGAGRAGAGKILGPGGATYGNLRKNRVTVIGVSLDLTHTGLRKYKFL